jgi:hypothetical protein
MQGAELFPNDEKPKVPTPQLFRSRIRHACEDSHDNHGSIPFPHENDCPGASSRIRSSMVKGLEGEHASILVIMD